MQIFRGENGKNERKKAKKAKINRYYQVSEKGEIEKS